MQDMEKMPVHDGDEKFNSETSKRWPQIIAAAGTMSIVTIFMISSSLFTSGSTKSALPMSFEASEQNKFSELPPNEQHRLFEQFMVHFGKSYADDEEKADKFKKFQQNLVRVDSRVVEQKKKGGKAKLGITKFSDMSVEEFKAGLLTAKVPATEGRQRGYPFEQKAYTGSSTEVDWAGIYTTAVKDQGYCGSCWAFSATEQIESDSIRAGLLTTADALSPQQIVSCDQMDWGCDGGYTELAYQYVKQTGGLESGEDYPYTSYWGRTGTCEVDSSEFSVTLDTYYTITGEVSMKDYVLSTGPLSVCLDAEFWSYYVGGVVTASECGTDVDHCVQVTGVNLSDESNPYWIIRNSWGTTWGLSGFIYVEYGTNACAITTDPTFVSPALV